MQIIIMRDGAAYVTINLTCEIQMKSNKGINMAVSSGSQIKYRAIKHATSHIHEDSLCDVRSFTLKSL